MSSELIGELGKVVGMGLEGGLVHSEVVVMEEEMGVPNATAVYQQQLPAVITTYNGSVILPPSTAQITATHTADMNESVKFGCSSIVEMEQEVVCTNHVSQEEVNMESASAIRKTAVKLNPRMSLEELGCHDNNTVVEEEVCCQENVTAAAQKLDHSRDDTVSTNLLSKSYACIPDPGTATRRGGPGPTKRQSQRYRKAWEQFPEFKDWLTSHHNVYRAVCRICNKVLLADFTVIKAHATGRRHMYLAERVTKGKQRLSTSRAETYMEESVVDGLTVSSESGTLSGGAEGESTFKEDFENKLPDVNRGNSGAGGGGAASGPAQTGDSSQASYTTGIYVPQQRNLPPTHNLSKAVVMSPAPNWKATAIVNGHVTRLDLSDYVGRYLILVFYPQDFSKICASEINALSDRSYEFRSIQTEIVACSVDSHLSHLTWSKLSRADGGVNLPKIPLIADPTHAIARAYGVLLPDKGHTLRAHFIIDKRGILRHMSVTDTLVGRGTDELLRIVKALQYVDEVEEAVPADWSQPSE
ncbi:uncharacterized protein isoform X2 [Rhodnius prolixus]|uniref:uncharacterized protein isoform X2 n=1 Tax=Rhodnius prolixus TaxID=13249 RepID=UPI003D188113